MADTDQNTHHFGQNNPTYDTDGPVTNSDQGSTTPATTPPTSSGPQQWDGSTAAPTDIPPIVANPVGAPPRVPGGHGGGGQNTSVDVPSLRTFAANVRALKAPVTSALSTLQGVSVQPGAFGTANTMRTGVAKHRDEFESVLTLLVEGLEDLGRATASLATTYESTEEANGMRARDLANQMAEADSDFSGILTAQPPA